MRNLQFDMARCIAVLYIIGFWHLIGYMNPSVTSSLTTTFTVKMVDVMLGTFMFISGYFLSKYNFSKWSEVKAYYIKRFKRFYILFFLSALTMYIGGMIPSFDVFLTTVTGLSPYILPQPKTLWFISILMGFYLITPVIRYRFSGKEIVDKYLGGVIVLLMNILLYWLSQKNVIDIRAFYCFECYSLGLVLGQTNTFEFMNKWCYLLIIVLAYIILLIRGCRLILRIQYL